ncbi:hypothetical protein BDR07DRAFT_1405093 [Suillus spraguei]|nr:hypothetical protein BDR07DRAFT_1405093 [Suillus spraguei]
MQPRSNTGCNYCTILWLSTRSACVMARYGFYCTSLVCQVVQTGAGGININITTLIISFASYQTCFARFNPSHSTLMLSIRRLIIISDFLDQVTGTSVES